MMADNEAYEDGELGASPTSDLVESEANQQDEQQVSSASNSDNNSVREYENKETTIEFSSLNDEDRMSEASPSTSPTMFSKNLSSVRLNQLDGSKEKTMITSASLASIHEQRRANDAFAISWQNLDYVVESKWYQLAAHRKPILNKLSGIFRSGQLSAVLGPSGAGKSTLIDCLLGKRDSGLCGKTRVLFNDPEVELERRRKNPLRIATIPQQDHLLDTLTVTETFMFASKIKNAHLVYEEEEDEHLKSGNPRKPFDHLANVQRVIRQLNLTSCATVRCGQLSGGQYKRVSIGQELLSRPDVMILDEPTSGLDSVTCYQTVKALRELIDSSPYPMAIVATIHQPDTDVFELFHKAYVLASGGRAIFEGPSDAIYERIQMGVELVEARKKMPMWSSMKASSELEQNLSRLREQLDERKRNPARLIVEVAANEYGFEITSAMTELQHFEQLDGNQFANQQTTIMSNIQMIPSGSSELDEINSNSSYGKTFKSSALSLMTLDQSRDISPPQFDYLANDPSVRRAELDKLLCLVKANMNQKRSMRVYLKHVWLHAQRSWLTILRDPMLFAVQILLHIAVPLLISYCFQGQRGDACPHVGPLDVIHETYREGSLLEDLNGELRVSFENIGYMFFQIYVIIFAAVCVTSLTYPLAMHVLLKEYRNGWYSLSSSFLGRTLADLPVPTVNVALAMAISYHLTGQPLSPYGWRFISVALLTILATLVAQTQGLMFGALLMNAPQAAVFVAPASTAPLVVVSGFLIRIQNLPLPLQLLSQLSYFTHLLNGFIVSRYGFNRCDCDELDFAAIESHQIPQQARGILNIWVETFANEYEAAKNVSVDLVDKLIDMISAAKTFGHQLTDCAQVKPFIMMDYQLDDNNLLVCYLALILMLIFYRWATYLVLSWKIKSCI